MKGFLGLYVDDEDLVHFQPDSTVYVEADPYTVRAIRRGNRGYEVAFSEVTDRDGADAIRGLDIHVSWRRRLVDNEYWPHDLVGLGVRPGGGVIVAVHHGPTQDRLVVERDGSTFEVPFVDELVPVVDIAGGFVEISEIEGLSPPSSR